MQTHMCDGCREDQGPQFVYTIKRNDRYSAEYDRHLCDECMTRYLALLNAHGLNGLT